MELTERDKKILVIGGGTAAAIALLFWLLSRQQTVIAGPAATTDQPTATGGSNDTPGPLGYTVYNVPPVSPVALGQQEAPTQGDCNCGCGAYGGTCLGNNQLGSGYTYANLGQYLQFLQNTNPNYVKLYAEMMSSYATSVNSSYMAG